MERRRFSAALQGQNLRFTGAGEGGSARARVGFLLLEHFSLPAFTQALDTLVTANLIRSVRESEINQKGKARKLWDIEEGKGI